MSEPGQAMLLIQGGPQSGQVVALGGLAVTIGRRSDNDVIVDDSSVSRRHTLIMQTAGTFVVRDLNSTNGTFVNRERLGDGDHTLKSGDLVRVGGSEITLLFKQDAPMTVRLSVPEAPAAEPGDKAKPDSVTGKAREMMVFLEGRRRVAVSREDIGRNVWPELQPGEDLNAAIDLAATEIRDVVEEDAEHPISLIAVGEFGYMLI
jgi:pSer/pThr/pTyr-binding forkhead associated (FHA) protein